MNYISKILIKLLKSRLILLKQALTLNRVRAVFLCLILITSFSLTSFVPWYTARALAAPKKSNSLNVENQTLVAMMVFTNIYLKPEEIKC